MNENTETALSPDNDPDEPSRSMTSKHKNIWPVIAEVVGVGIFGTLSNNAFSTDHKIAGIWLSFAALASLLAILGTTLADRFSRFRVWGGYIVGLILVGGWFTRWTWVLARPEPKPHFTLSLQIGDSPTAKMFLTNDFLFAHKFAKFGDLPDGAINVKGFVPGCVVIPIQEGESNKIFNFSAENDSSVRVSDFEVVVGFPKEWKCGFDHNWHEVDAFLIVDEALKFSPTNEQYIAVRSPWNLYPKDCISFPAITNPCVPEYVGTSLKAGVFEVAFRSPGFTDVVSANVIFMPGSSNFSKPFVVQGEFRSDGLMRLLISDEEFAKTQQ